ncbi:MAG: ADP-ribosylglycohydrolase family protein [Verrucomicrobiota bacterium]
MSHAAKNPVSVGTSAEISFLSRLYGAVWGYFIGDALAMPTHGYSVIKRIRNDYGHIDGYRDPITPHPQSTLFRTHYEPTGERGKILHGRDAEWRVPGTHYHHHLRGGDNTLNIELGRSLLENILDKGTLDRESYAETYTRFFLDPEGHRDTYITNAHRAFFLNYGQGKTVWQCGIETNRIGGIAIILPQALLMTSDLIKARKQARLALSLTHKGEAVATGADLLIELLFALLHGYGTEHALYNVIRNVHAHPALNYPYRRWIKRENDEEVMEHHCKNGSSVDDAIPLILYLALKYEQDFAGALLANANFGGDNCPRGAVLGMLMGAAVGCEAIPAVWAQGLSAHDQIDSLADRIAQQSAASP